MRSVVWKRLGAFMALVVLSSMVMLSPASASSKATEYSFTFVNGVTITGSSTEKNHFIANAGGTSADSPTGMTVHLSCSDKFTGGWGQKKGPNQVLDPAWQIASYTITKFKKDGKVDKTCSDILVPGPAPSPSIDIEKLVNGLDADTPPGPEVPVGDFVTLDYIVTNTGNIDLSKVTVTDFDLGPIPCPKSTLEPGESMTCDSQSVEVTNTGLTFMEAGVEGTAVIMTSPTSPPSGDKGYSYAFTFVNGKTVTGTSTNNEPFVAGVGGSDPENPTGTLIHVSCSDKFTGGWGQKKGPNQVLDPAWQIASYTITKFKKDGKVDKTCGDPFVPVEQIVTDTDPIHYTGIVPAVPAVDIEKSVNGFDADEAPGPQFTAGTTLTFDYVVTNTGDVTLTDLAVEDDTLGPIVCPVTTLAPGESTNCGPETKTAMVGTFYMEATVTGIGNGTTVTDTDPVNFTVVKKHMPRRSVNIESYVNGHDADEAPGPQFKAYYTTLTFDYVVTNSGRVQLTDITVSDSELGEVTCAATTLHPGESTTCTPIVTPAKPGTYTHIATVDAYAKGKPVSDTDPVNYSVRKSYCPKEWWGHK